MIRETSRQSYFELLPVLTRRQQTVLNVLADQYPQAVDNLTIAGILGTEVAYITPRTNELNAYGVITEAGTHRNPKTKREVILYRLSDEMPTRPEVEDVKRRMKQKEKERQAHKCTHCGGSGVEPEPKDPVQQQML